MWCQTNCLTSWYREVSIHSTVRETVIVTEPRGSTLSSEKPLSGTCSEQFHSNPHCYNQVFYNPFHIILPFLLLSSMCILSVKIPNLNFVEIFLFFQCMLYALALLHELKLWSSLLCNFLKFPYYFFLFPQILSVALIFQICFSVFFLEKEAEVCINTEL
jgi:hypothetical protein